MRWWFQTSRREAFQAIRCAVAGDWKTGPAVAQNLQKTALPEQQEDKSTVSFSAVYNLYHRLVIRAV